MIKLREIFMVDNGVGKFHGNGTEVRAADLSICMLRNYWPHYWSSRVHSERFISWIARSCSFCRSRPEPSVMGSIGRPAYLTRGICIRAQTYTYTCARIRIRVHLQDVPKLFGHTLPHKVFCKSRRTRKYECMGTEVHSYRAANGWYVILQFAEHAKPGQTFDKRRIYEARTQA